MDIRGLSKEEQQSELSVYQIGFQKDLNNYILIVVVFQTFIYLSFLLEFFTFLIENPISIILLLLLPIITGIILYFLVYKRFNDKLIERILKLRRALNIQ